MHYKDSFEELKKIFALVYHIIKEQGLDLLNEEILIVINYVSINYGSERTQDLISEIGGEEELITLDRSLIKLYKKQKYYSLLNSK
ncbi:hypothetical protein V4762_08095 [Thermodesulfobium sp. 4217-1]|uniref:hypothetical protein n=1 Tax=Thermodesulfobium sp. 4217-1 TaxID=3120013 RepID=UPI003221C82B